MTLDLNGYALSFAEEWDTLDATPHGPSKWICHTPWNGDFGNSTFTDIDAVTPHVFPFDLKGGLLHIYMKKGTDGKWRSGLLSAVDANRNGFQQIGGYFSCKMKVPNTPGAWPAFWLGSMDNLDGLGCEIDVIEYYGHDTTTYMVNAHLWSKNPNIPSTHQSAVVHVPAGSLSTDLHVFGVMILPGELVFYRDNAEVARLQVSNYFSQKKMFPMVNLAAGGGWPITNMQDCFMTVDYIHAYQQV